MTIYLDVKSLSIQAIVATIVIILIVNTAKAQPENQTSAQLTSDLSARLVCPKGVIVRYQRGADRFNRTYNGPEMDRDKATAGFCSNTINTKNGQANVNSIAGVWSGINLRDPENFARHLVPVLLGSKVKQSESFASHGNAPGGVDVLLTDIFSFAKTETVQINNQAYVAHTYKFTMQFFGTESFIASAYYTWVEDPRDLTHKSLIFVGTAPGEEYVSNPEPSMMAVKIDFLGQ